MTIKTAYKGVRAMIIIDVSAITPKKFKRLRRSAHLTLQEAASLFDTNEISVWNYERGDETIPVSAKLIVLGRSMRRAQLAKVRSVGQKLLSKRGT
jgi:hypothetical protein